MCKPNFGKLNIFGKFASAISISLFLGVSTFAQVVVPSPERPQPRATPNPIAKPEPAAKPERVAVPRKPTRPAPIVVNESEFPAEKAINVEPKVNISLCISEGKVTVNGWDRNEIRALVTNGSEVGFKVLQKKEKPVWVEVLGYDPLKVKNINVDDCLSGQSIELNVPTGATVNLKSRESETSITDVAKVRVENVGGDIDLRNIANGIEAKTYEGDVTVENSSGAMSLNSTTGNILAFEVSSDEIGDIFKAKTANGAITLQNIGHTQVEANSSSGSVRFIGGMIAGGRYSIGTQNGTITFLIPTASSCKINATYNYGVFNSEIPMKNIQKSPAGSVQKLTATLGSGEANLTITTFNGAIRIRKSDLK
jgi:Putative adhesin